MRARWITSTLTAACLLLWSAWAHAQVHAKAQPASPLRLGVKPQFPSVELHRQWTPIAQTLAKACGQPVVFQVSLSIPQFEGQLLKGDFDIAYTNPYHAVMAKKAQGYVPLVREGKRAHKGVLVARAESTVQTLADLEGQRIAYPAPNAFGASLCVRALLEREHQVETQADYVGTHSNAYRHVIVGHAAAAGGVMTTLSSEPPAISSQLRVLYETQAFAPNPIVVHPRVSAAVQACITRTLTQGAGAPALQRLLDAVQMPDPITASYARDYEPLERLALERYVVLQDKP